MDTFNRYRVKEREKTKHFMQTSGSNTIPTIILCLKNNYT